MKTKQLGSILIAALLFTVLVFAGSAGADGTIVINDGTTTELSSDDVGTIVYGSHGGYAKLTAVDGDTWTLELTDFNATEENQIMSVTGIPNLRIVLNGTSNLVGAYDDYSYGLLNVEMGNLTITTKDGKSGKLVVNNTVTRDWLSVFAISAVALTIDSGADVTAIANISTPHMAYALSMVDGDIRISGEETVVTAIAAGGTWTFALETAGNILIEHGATVRAQSISISDDGYVHPESGAIFTSNGDIVISDSARVTAVAESTDTAYAYALRSNQTFVDNCVVDAYAASRNFRAEAMSAENKMVIGKGTVLHAVAAGMPGYAVVTDDTAGAILISDGAMIAASGSNSSFVIKNAGNFNITSLTDTHMFQNGTQPITYGNLVSDWHSCEFEPLYAHKVEQFNASNYTAVTIASKAATSQSPAPFVGLLAGLGAVALVLTRIRK